MSKVLKESQKQLIEKIGVYLEREGQSPAMARIQALLLVSDEVELTFEEIYQSLGISKSTASSAIMMLQSIERIEYITKPGDRRRYFRSKIASWINSFENKLTQFHEVKMLFQEVLDQRSKDTKDFNKNMHMLISFMDFMESEMPALIEKFKKKHIK